jgi:sensor histidine kinase YesM
LVENAVKHGIAGSRGGGYVAVSATVSDDIPPVMHIVVRNTGAGLGAHSSTAGSGIGLQNVARRLRCYYGDAAAVTLSSNDAGETVAELRLPIRTVVDDAATALVEQARP